MAVVSLWHASGTLAFTSVPDFRIEIGHPASDELLNDLFAASWPDHRSRAFAPVLSRSLAHACALEGVRLIGFGYLAWDGGEHAFLLDPTVHPDARRRGIGTALVRALVDAARQRGLRWVHVDFEAELAPFYRACGFRSSAAGILDLR